MSLPNLVPRGDNTGSLGTASKRWSTIYAYNLDSSTPQSGIFSGSFSGSFEGDGSGLTGITTTLPSGLVSGSSQISYNGITDVPSGIVSSSTQINSGSFSGSFQGDGSGLTNIVSSSYSLTASYALNSTTLPTGVVSGSSQISYNGITDVPSGILSSSAQISSDISGSFTEASSSFSTRVTTLESVPASAGLWTGSGDFISRLGDVQITGSLTVSSSITANSFIGNGSGLTNVVSSSYSVTSSHATSVAIDSVDVEDLSATGTPSGITYLRGDNTWATVAGSGDVSKVGTPVDNQVGVWTGDGTIEGNTTFTFDSTTGGVTATSFTGSINTSSIDNFNTEVSRSAAGAGFGTGGGTPLPSGLLSSSAQIASDISGSFTSTSASIAVNITTNLTNFNTLNNKTLVSGSSQISYTSITNVPSGILSSSTQIESEISGAFSDTSSSLAGRITSQENFSSSLDATFWTEAEQLVYSGSVSTRFTTNETDITNLQTDSGSFSTRVTSNETSITSLNANSSSYVTNSVTSSMTVASSSYAVTASYIEYNNVASAPIIKNGLVTGGSFSGNPKTATITFTSPYVDNNYTITVSGENNRTFTIESKIAGSFVINSNSNQTLSGNTFWQTINIGEFN
jgi:trimeric autotransporter adhesin